MKIFMVLALVLFAGCKATDPFGGKEYLNCRRVSEIEYLPALQVTVEKIQPCGVILKTEDGRTLSLAGPIGGDPEVISFMRTLNQGNSYTFPDAFIEFQKRNKK